MKYSPIYTNTGKRLKLGYVTNENGCICLSFMKNNAVLGSISVLDLFCEIIKISSSMSLEDENNKQDNVLCKLR